MKNIWQGMAKTAATVNAFSAPSIDTPPEKAERRARMAKRLRELQAQSGLSIRQLAKRAQLSRQTVFSALKSGLTTSPRTYQQLFAVLETTPQLERALLEPRFSQEDLEIAMAYHDACTPVRNFVAKIFGTREYSNPELPPDILMLAHRITRLTEQERRFVKMYVDAMLDGRPDDQSPPETSDGNRPDRPNH